MCFFFPHRQQLLCIYKYLIRVIQVNIAEKGQKNKSAVQLMRRHCPFVFISDTYLAQVPRADGCRLKCSKTFLWDISLINSLIYSVTKLEPNCVCSHLIRFLRLKIVVSTLIELREDKWLFLSSS